MRIFLSYASERRDLAEQIADSIRARGHSVFFDRDDLPAGETYEDQIEKAIQRSGLFVFLISPESVADRRFTRTELLIAKRKWATAKKRVLPVMIAETKIEDIPSYLKTVSILEPEGSIPAETAVAVQELIRPWKRRAYITAASAAAVAAGYGAWTFQQQITEDPWQIEALPNAPEQRALFGAGPIDRLGFKITNDSAAPKLILSVDLKVEPSGALEIISQVDALAYVGNPIERSRPFEGHFDVQPPESELEQITYSICFMVEDGAEQCSSSQEYVRHAPGSYPYGNADNLPEAWSADIQQVELSEDDAFLVATGREVIRLDAADFDLWEGLWEGESITEMHSGPFGVILGILDKDLSAKLLRLDLSTGLSRQLTISFPSDLSGTFGEPISTRVTQISNDENVIWVMTGDGNGAEGIAYTTEQFEQLTVPPYFDEISFDLQHLNLRAGTEWIYSGNVGVVPSDLIALSINAYREVSGHDIDTVSCVSDVLQVSTDLLVHNCDGDVLRAKWEGDRFVTGAELARLPGYQNDEVNWPEVMFFKNPEELLFGAVSTLSNEAFGGNGQYRSIISQLDFDSGPQVLFEANDARVLDIEAGKKYILAVLENSAGRRETVVIAVKN